MQKLTKAHVHNIVLLPLSGQYKYCSSRDETNDCCGETGPLQKQIHIHRFILTCTARK